MWYPGNQSFYNAFLSPDIPQALARSYSQFALADSARHVGLGDFYNGPVPIGPEHKRRRRPAIRPPRRRANALEGLRGGES